MSSANRIVLWLLGIVLLGGILWYGYWFATNFERHSKEVRSSVSPEARKNRFLAAERFLQQTGQAVMSHAGRDIFSLKPAVKDTIFIGSNSRLFLQRNHDALMEWVKAGGHLILVPPIYDDEEDRFTLIEQLDVELIRLDKSEQQREDVCPEKEKTCNELSSLEAEPESNDGDTADRNKRIIATFQAAHPGEYKARFLADRYLHDAEGRAEVAVGVGSMANLLRFSVESGAITVLSDIDLFTNDFIGEYDHAYLFARLVDTPGKVWIFYSADMPSLLALLWQRMPYLLLIVITFLLLAGWHMMLNSGPKLHAQYDSRRNLLEHLEATANYSWRIDKARQLFTDNRHAVEQAWRRRHPQLTTMNKHECCEWISEKTGMTANAIERTLYGDIATEQDFIRATAVLQRLATRVNQYAGSASGNRS